MNFFIVMVVCADEDESCAEHVESLAGVKITKMNALAGAVVVVNKVGPASYNGVPTQFNGRLPIYNQHELLNTVGHAFEGEMLEILEPPTKKENVVSVLVKMADGTIGRVFWIEFKYSTRLVSEGRATVPVKTKKATLQLKFPGRRDATALDRGLTFYGRPFAKIGELVWLGNSSRSMSPKYLGRVALDAVMPADLSTGYVAIELVTGEKTSLQPIWVIPLERDEIRSATEMYRDQISVDWFK
jgi:hypothetical protein